MDKLIHSLIMAKKGLKGKNIVEFATAREDHATATSQEFQQLNGSSSQSQPQPNKSNNYTKLTLTQN